MELKKILVLGGYGNFGKRICEALAQHRDVELIISGRNLEKAELLCKQMKGPKIKSVVRAAALDIFSSDFAEQLKHVRPFLVIHTGGPFQGQDYRVPLACVGAGSHYIDLADDRRFVCDILSLDQLAKANNVSVISGASSVPGLSSTVIDKLSGGYSRIDTVDIAIAPGNRAERGEATVKAILSYTGHLIDVFEQGTWTKKRGWMSPRKIDFGEVVGRRWLANVNVPDLELFPARYNVTGTVNFQAGLELSWLHWCMVFMAWCAKKGIVKNWAPLVKPIVSASNFFIGFGTDVGGMMIRMSGLDENAQSKDVLWRLTAKHGVGPYIPTLSAIILAQKLIAGVPVTPGATACLGLYSLEEFDSHASSWGIYHETFINGVMVTNG